MKQLSSTGTERPSSSASSAGVRCPCRGCGSQEYRMIEDGWRVISGMSGFSPLDRGLSPTYSVVAPFPSER